MQNADKNEYYNGMNANSIAVNFVISKTNGNENEHNETNERRNCEVR